MLMYVLLLQYIHQETPCDRYDVEVSLVNSSPDLLAYYKEHEEIFQYVAKYSGYTMTSDDVYESFWHIDQVYDALLIEVRTGILNISFKLFALHNEKEAHITSSKHTNFHIQK